MDTNDPDYVWTVWKRADGSIVGPSTDDWTARATYAVLSDTGEWREVGADDYAAYMSRPLLP